jgi:D-alanine-D-alanine ligase
VVVQAYVLIQTEVGKAADVAKAIAEIPGVNLAEDVTLEVPASLPPPVLESVQRLSVAAFEALGCEGLARVDFFLQHDGALLVNEVNTMPGFTPASMYPRMWAESGVEYPELVDRLLTLALSRSTGLR